MGKATPFFGAMALAVFLLMEIDGQNMIAYIEQWFQQAFTFDRILGTTVGQLQTWELIIIFVVGLSMLAIVVRK